MNILIAVSIAYVKYQLKLPAWKINGGRKRQAIIFHLRFISSETP
jgi:hypothetical protein